MTLVDAAGLAILALHDRRLISAMLRVLQQHATAEDYDALPPRLADESSLAWACRVRSGNRPDVTRDELHRVQDEANAQIGRAATAGIIAVAIGDQRYPSRLSVIPDPPAVIWIRGRVDVLSRAAIGIVGSRAATTYGLDMARRLALDLTSAGMAIVSGLARGVDSAAHAAVVSGGGTTVGVLGCGVDRVYPAEHRTLARDMEEKGAVISEFPPGVPPLPHHFPMRNRIISGLSLGVVVVEAPEKSGSLITASAAADQGREVFVVPGHVTGGRNRGGHLLIRDGAKLVETADDILQELNIALPGATRPCAALPERSEFTVDEVAASTGERPNVVLARLLELELQGQIQRIGGGRFVRVIG